MSCMTSSTYLLYIWSVLHWIWEQIIVLSLKQKQSCVPELIIAILVHMSVYEGFGEVSKVTLRENIICFPRKFFGTSHFPVTRKTLVTKDSPNDGSSNVFRVIINLFRCQNHDKYGIYGISFLLKHIFLVWLNFGEKKMAVTATEHWQQCGKVFSKTVTKGKLKNKSYCFQNKCFYWYFSIALVL